MAISQGSSTAEQLKSAFLLQREAFASSRNEPLKRRKDLLRALRAWIKANRTAIHEALYADFGKPAAEADGIEIFHVLSELRFALANLKRWARPRYVRASLAMVGTRSQVVYEPKGVCLILSPWNYPFSLSAGPLISALAAGNTAIIKPSEHTPHTSGLIRRMAQEVFEPQVVTVFEGDAAVARGLLTLPFDHIFFTGSPAVGKQVMRAASEHLTPVTLELGGKSPAIVTDTARVGEAAQRIAVAKFVNAGQTCIAPDYVLVHASVHDAFVAALADKIKHHFADGASFESSASYTRLVNHRHFERLRDMLDEAVAAGARIVLGGTVDAASRFMAPVVLTDVPAGVGVLEDEIFGPILPVVIYNTLDEALQFIHEREKPLALYVFTKDDGVANYFLRQTSSGGVCINDCAIHFLHHHLPFGGVGASGLGKAHGHYGFLAFSNEKPVLHQRHGFTGISMFYPPYTGRTQRLMEWFLKLF